MLAITYSLSNRGNVDQFMPRHNSHVGKPKELREYTAAPFLLHTLKTAIDTIHAHQPI